MRRLTAAVAGGGLMVVGHTSSHAQAPPLGTTANFSVLAGAGITNTGPTVITGTAANPGDLGSTTSTIGGFPPGTLAPPAIIHPINDGPTITAQSSLTTAYNNLAGRPPTADLTGHNLGGLTLVPGVYNFSSTAQLTGNLTLNGLGNPNSVFIFNIGSALTTASSSSVTLINGAQGGDVFWRVGSSATLGTSTAFAGDILALTSITLNTGADITCGAAWARNGAVTLDTNTISICALVTGGGGTPLGPTGVPLFVFLLPPNATTNERTVAAGLDSFSSSGGTLPFAFLNLFNLSPADLANALTQLSGELGTGAAQAGTQAMNSFLSLVTNPFPDSNRTFAPERPANPMYVKALDLGVVSDPRRWGVWAAGYGGQTSAAGDPFGAGTHDRSVSAFGSALGVDYRVTRDTVVGVAIAEGGTRYGLSDNLGSGRSDMFQAAVYSSTRINAAYISAALAYSWQRVTTDRYVVLSEFDHLTADFAANDVGGRIEGGYRFPIWGMYGVPGRFGVTPYAAAQVQSFHTPAYNETAQGTLSSFALAYGAHTTNTARSEVGDWVDWNIPVFHGNATLQLLARTAWAHDYWSSPDINAMFQMLPGSNFTVTGAAPATDLLLASVGAAIWFRNGISLAVRFDGEFAENSMKYAGTGQVRYTW